MSDASSRDATSSDLEQPRRREPSPQSLLIIALVLACALVVAIAVGIFLGVRYVRTNDTGSTAQPAGSASEQQERRDVQAAAAAFVANINSYSVKDIDSYRERLKPLLTSSFAQSFDLAVENIVQQVKVTDMTSEGDVLLTAVSSVDRDNATALVIADAHVTSALGERLRHFRWKVSLVKQEQTWLVDDFKAVE